MGRVLIDRHIIPKDQMSMQRIRLWMEEKSCTAPREVRQQNRSYVFFREVQLAEKDEAVGAQGVPGVGRAFDRGRQISCSPMCTPFFIEGNLPVESEQSKTPFRRLVVAQDTGSAIVGPARVDIGLRPPGMKRAGSLAGAHLCAQFVMLIPQSLDPLAARQDHARCRMRARRLRESRRRSG